MNGYQQPMQNFEKKLTLAGKQARYYDFATLGTNEDSSSQDTKPIAHFYGGNGFAVGVYEPLLTELSQQFNVISLAMRGYWVDLPTDKILTREQDADYLIEFLEQTQNGPVIGIGHSQGATATAMAAAKRPDLFSALYLIDPVTFTKKQTFIYGHIPRPILLTQEPFKSTKTKPNNWSSIDAYYQSLRDNRAYRRISDQHLKLFAKNSLIKKQEDSYQLLFESKYELASYFGTPYVTPALKKLNNTKVNYLLILAKPSVFNSDKVRDSWKKIVPDSHIVTLTDYGHLLPIEAPEQCAKVIFESYKKTNPQPSKPS